MSSPMRRAKNGLRLLREHGSQIGYEASRINRANLDMAHSHTCVIGQGSEINYTDALKRLYRAQHGLSDLVLVSGPSFDRWIEWHGFDSGDVDQSYQQRQADLRLLTAAWSYLLLKDELAAVPA